MRKISARFNCPQKLCAKIVAPIAVALGIMAGIVGPANADVSPNSLQTATHTCRSLGSNGIYTPVFCVDLALYKNGNGKYFVTLQVEGYCEIAGGITQCLGIFTDGSVNNANPSNTDWTTMWCGYPPQPSQTQTPCFTNESNNKTYFWPYGGIPITPGGNCDQDIWGVLEGNDNTSITVLSTAGNGSYNGFGLQSPLETGHYNVCLSATDKISATPV